MRLIETAGHEISGIINLLKMADEARERMLLTAKSDFSCVETY